MAGGSIENNSSDQKNHVLIGFFFVSLISEFCWSLNFKESKIGTHILKVLERSILRTQKMKARI